MNDEQGFDPRQMSPEERRRSKWAVQPGSISDSLSFRRPARMDDSSVDEHSGSGRPRRKRRPAAEIIRGVRGVPAAGNEATRVSDVLPSVPSANDASQPPGAPQRTEPSRPVASRAAMSKAAAARAEASRSAESPPTAEARSSRPMLHDESTRVTPDLGENRDLRAATGGSSSSLVMAGFGGVILVAIGGLVGAILDYLFTDRLGIVTAIGLTLGAVVAALVTRKRDLVSVIVAPPIVYAVIATIVLLISSRPIRITSIADVAIRGFPAMALATGVAAVIAGARLVMSRVGERR